MLLIFQNVMPVFVLMALGRALGRTKFIPREFFAASDRLVYFIFFPALLFWKIGGAESSRINWSLTGPVLGLLLTAWLLSLVYVKATRAPDFQVGAFSQCCYRFNTYIGFAVVLSSLGEEGVREFSLLISLLIPTLNLMAVSTLIWHSQSEYSFRDKTVLFFKAALANPLIIACLAGLLYSNLKIPLPVFFRNTFELASVAALPLALLAIGNSLTLEKLKGNFRPALVAAMIKQGFLPAAGFFLLPYLGVSGVALKAGLLYLAMPTSVAAFILSSQLNSDADLASACIVLSTLLSFFSLSAVMLTF
ncbi:MAG: AEC family transporter [Pseudomonadota bacterium]